MNGLSITLSMLVAVVLTAGVAIADRHVCPKQTVYVVIDKDRALPYLAATEDMDIIYINSNFGKTHMKIPCQPLFIGTPEEIERNIERECRL